MPIDMAGMKELGRKVCAYYPTLMFSQRKTDGQTNGRRTAGRQNTTDYINPCATHMVKKKPTTVKEDAVETANLAKARSKKRKDPN